MAFTGEQAAVQRLVRQFADDEIRPVAAEHEQQGRFPADIVEKAHRSDLTAPTIPEEYGGGGMDLTAALVIKEELHRADPGIGEIITSLTFGCGSILEYGTEEQAQEYVVPATRGDLVTGVAMTEPTAGSDFASIESTAERDGDSYVLNGDKVFISNGSVADVLIVYARTEDTDTPHRGISAFIVETDSEGLEQTAMEGFIGPSTSELGQVFMDDVRVPADALLGEKNRGFYQAMEFLDEQRLLVAASSVGTAQGALDLTVDYVTDRQQFDRRIAEFQAVRHRLANLQARIEAVRSLVYTTAESVGSGTEDGRGERPAMAKLLATTLAEDVASEAVQLHGGYGCFDEYRVETYLRATKAPQIYEGTNEILREVIADSILEDA